ncbi:hypothetical protein MIR68_010666 [Amoeboaphelidium protococcarum]|nr:hypothetical protein MIR68_010666 [Amoeboaphelidium protococcarum]
MTNSPNVYGAVYSGVHVYEFICRGIAVMRRRCDNFLNATQILKVAQIEKGRRTKILEREIQVPNAVFEKVQGGYGKYQGTWVPFERGVGVARQYGVEGILADLLEFVPPEGEEDRAMFEVTPSKKRKLSNASQTAADRPSNPQSSVSNSQNSHVQSNNNTNSNNGGLYANAAPPSNAEKYRAILMSVFLNHESHKVPPLLTNPSPPADMDADMIIDDQGHTAIHWASALARITALRMLIGNLGADVTRQNFNGESALVRAVLVTNCFESDCFGDLLATLGPRVIGLRDKKGRTVLHHIVLTAGIKGRAQAAKYYLDTLLQFMREPSAMLAPTLPNDSSQTSAAVSPDFVYIESLIDIQDKNGDTALNIASRLSNRNLVEMLIETCNADISLPNRCGLRPVDFGMDDVMLKPVFERCLEQLQSGDSSSQLPRLPSTVSAFSSILPHNNSNNASQQTLVSHGSGIDGNNNNNQMKSRQLSQQFEGVMSTLEHDLGEKEKLYFDAVSQVHSLGQELAQSRKIISLLSQKLSEHVKDQNLLQLLAQQDSGNVQNSSMTQEQIWETRCMQMAAILKAHDIAITPDQLSLLSDAQTDQQPQQNKSQVNGGEQPSLMQVDNMSGLENQDRDLMLQRLLSMDH